MAQNFRSRHDQSSNMNAINVNNEIKLGKLILDEKKVNTIRAQL